MRIHFRTQIAPDRSQRGNFIMSTAIATLVMALVALGYATQSSDTVKITNGTIMGNQLQTVANALNAYITANAAQLAASTPPVISDVNLPYAPTISELKLKNYLDKTFQDKPTYGTSYVTKIEKAPGCSSDTGCPYIGTVRFSDPVYSPNGFFDLITLQAAANASKSSQIGYSLPTAPSIIQGPGWNISNPVSTPVSGILLARSDSVQPTTTTSSPCPKYNETNWIDCTSKTQLINSTGQRNTVIGIDGLKSNTTGAQNTAVGALSLASNATGTYNSALGAYTLKANTSGSYNIAIGDSALYENTIGSDNVAIGIDSQRTGGSTAVINGNQSIVSAGNVSVGRNALMNNSTGRWNVAIGTNSMLKNNTGDGNVAIGYTVFNKNTSGSNNIAVGMESLFANTEGTDNLGLGKSALKSNITGKQNISLGLESLNKNQTGNDNIALGYRALFENLAGKHNFAAGYTALSGNVGGEGNIAIGHLTQTALGSGNFNVALGYQALQVNTNDSNIGIGYQSLIANTTGKTNVGIGYQALLKITTGSDNVAIGNGANANTDPAISKSTAIGPGAAAIANESTAIGYGASATVAKTMVLGGSTLAGLYSAQQLNSSSDRRLKSDIVTEHNGLDFINRLRPVTYEFKANPGKRHSGFIAQEVLEVEPDFTGISKPQSDSDFYGLTYTEFIGPLTKAVQELDGKLKVLDKGTSSDNKLYLLYLGLFGLFAWNCRLQFRLTSINRQKTI